jgi:hypothetical protein
MNNRKIPKTAIKVMIRFSIGRLLFVISLEFNIIQDTRDVHPENSRAVALRCAPAAKGAAKRKTAHTFTGYAPFGCAACSSGRQPAERRQR